MLQQKVSNIESCQEIEDENLRFLMALCVCAELLQLSPTLPDPMDCSPQAPLSMGFSR